MALPHEVPAGESMLVEVDETRLSEERLGELLTALEEGRLEQGNFDALLADEVFVRAWIDGPDDELKGRASKMLYDAGLKGEYGLHNTGQYADFMSVMVFSWKY